MVSRLSHILDAATRHAVRSEGRSATHAAIDASFAQGRTLFGGSCAALAIANAVSALPASASVPLRSVQLTFAGPSSPGQIDCHAEVLRSGKSITSVHSRLSQANQCTLAMTAVFGTNRSTTVHVNADAMDNHGNRGARPPDRESLETFERHPALPAFLDHFDLRWVTGTVLPVNPRNGRRVAVYVRHRDLDLAAKHPAAAIIALADMPPPAIFLHYDKPTTGSSVTWSLEFIVPPESIEHGADDGWFYLDYHLDAARDGYSLQSGNIYDGNGRLVAVSRQCMVYFDPKNANSKL